MMTVIARSIACIALLAPAMACTDSRPPSAPSSIPQTPSVAPTPVPTPLRAVPGFPPVSRPARVYGGVESTWATSYHGSPLASRYLLYLDGTFALQYSSANYPFFEYPGTYREENGRIRFDFSDDGRWSATGTVDDKSLTVKYNDMMIHSDFEDASYPRLQ